jgi:hypothetical protein
MKTSWGKRRNDFQPLRPWSAFQSGDSPTSVGKLKENLMKKILILIQKN